MLVDLIRPSGAVVHDMVEMPDFLTARVFFVDPDGDRNLVASDEELCYAIASQEEKATDATSEQAIPKLLVEILCNSELNLPEDDDEEKKAIMEEMMEASLHRIADTCREEISTLEERMERKISKLVTDAEHLLTLKLESLEKSLETRKEQAEEEYVEEEVVEEDEDIDEEEVLEEEATSGKTEKQANVDKTPNNEEEVSCYDEEGSYYSDDEDSSYYSGEEEGCSGRSVESNPDSSNNTIVGEAELVEAECVRAEPAPVQQETQVSAADKEMLDHVMAVLLNSVDELAVKHKASGRDYLALVKEETDIQRTSAETWHKCVLDSIALQTQTLSIRIKTKADALLARLKKVETLCTGLDKEVKRQEKSNMHTRNLLTRKLALLEGKYLAPIQAQLDEQHQPLALPRPVVASAVVVSEEEEEKEVQRLQKAESTVAAGVPPKMPPSAGTNKEETKGTANYQRPGLVRAAAMAAASRPTPLKERHTLAAARKDRIHPHNSRANKNDDDTGSVLSQQATCGAIQQSSSRQPPNNGAKDKTRGERKQVKDLVEKVIPDEIDNLSTMMEQFSGREADLINTLQTMDERTFRERARATVHKTQGKIDPLASGGYSIASEGYAVIAAASSLGPKPLQRAKSSSDLAERTVDSLELLKPLDIGGNNNDDDQSTASSSSSSSCSSGSSSGSSGSGSGSGSGSDSDDSTIERLSQSKVPKSFYIKSRAIEDDESTSLIPASITLSDDDSGVDAKEEEDQKKPSSDIETATELEEIHNLYVDGTDATLLAEFFDPVHVAQVVSQEQMAEQEKQLQEEKQQQPKSSSMRVFVESPADGRVLAIDNVDLNDTIRDFKAKLARQNARNGTPLFPPYRQMLSYKGTRMLGYYTTLKEYGIHGGATLTLT
jgi:hypothetical protein